jgi:hypothetical protein
MPKWNSLDGVWHPTKEKKFLKNHETGEEYLYEGPDRAALYELHKNQVENLGQDFRRDPETIDRVRKLGFKDMAEYLEYVGYDEEKVKAKFDKESEKINLHELPKKVKAIEVMGGGKDFAGQGQDKPGGFGKPSEL